MSDDLEEITVAAGRTVSNGRGWPPRVHGPGAVLRVSPAEAAQLRESGHAIDPNARLVRVQNPAGTTNAAGAIEVSPQGPVTNPGLIGNVK